MYRFTETNVSASDATTPLPHPPAKSLRDEGGSASLDVVFSPNGSLPPLCWLCEFDSGRHLARVTHGPFVETGDRFFVEGVWDADFAKGGFDTTDCVFGSGAVFGAHAITFVSSCATTDFLYYFIEGAVTTVSNSLPLLLGATGNALDPVCRSYPDINDSITRGIYDYRSAIPTLKGDVVRIMYFNMILDEYGIGIVEKPMPPPFADFAAYASYLDEKIGRLAENARSARRARPLRIYSTQSKGYDTTAINSIAARYGVDGAFTVTRSKARHRTALSDAKYEDDDDGTPICRILGIDPIPLDRRRFVADFEDEYLFYGAMHLAQDANLLGLHDHIAAPAVLITGALGEIWYTAESSQVEIDDRLRRFDLGNHGCAEWRLKTGFVQAALPFIGARRRIDIYRISLSPEMAEWRLDTAYDRPIPRRMGEEAGIPRGLFGQKKMATVIELPEPSIPVGRKLRAEFYDFARASGLCSPVGRRLMPFVHKINTAIGYATPRNRYRYIYYLQRIASRLFRRPVRIRPLRSDLNGALFCFCVNKRAAEYRVWLERPPLPIETGLRAICKVQRRPEQDCAEKARKIVA